MALSKEDHKDVKGALGKAMANKISKVTRDKKQPVEGWRKAQSDYKKSMGGKSPEEHYLHGHSSASRGIGSR